MYNGNHNTIPRNSNGNGNGNRNDPFIDCSQIISLNNDGATSLMSGDIALSISLFCQALHTSKSCLGRRDEQRRLQYEQQQRDRDDDIDGSSRFYHDNEHDDDDIYYHDNDDNGNGNDNDGSNYYDYNKPVVSHFDIGQLMEAGCFGLDDNDNNINDVVEVNTNNNSNSKVSSSSDSSLSRQ
jgi:hypothetical protein